MSFLSLNRFFVFFLLFTVNFIASAALFEGMKASINKKLILSVQKIPNRSKTHQLQYSVFSQLQNAQKYQDIINTIDLIATQIKKEQKGQEEIEMLFSVALVSSTLSLVAKKLYTAIAKIRSIIYYWKKIDDYSVLRYVLTHSPRVWDVKLKHDFHIKQKIMSAEHLCKKYISYLGYVSQLTQQMPSDITSLEDTISWIDESLSIMYKCSGQKYNKISPRDDFNTRKFLYDFRAFLETFESTYNEKFQKEKESISIPSYTTRSFGKIALTMLSLVGSGLFVWYKYAQIGEWWNKGYEKFSDLIQKNIVNNVKTVYNQVFFEKKAQTKVPTKDFDTTFNQIIKEFNTLNEEYVIEKIKWTPTTEEMIQLKNEFITIFGNKLFEMKDLNGKILEKNAIESKMDEVIQKGDVIEFKKVFVPLLARGRMLGEGQKLIESSPLFVEFIMNNIPKDLYKLLEIITKGGATLFDFGKEKNAQINDVLEEKDELIKEIESLRVLALLTPTIFTGLGSGWMIKKIYNFFTNRDYSILKRALKELETVTICSIKTPNNYENYGMFVFLLENLKLGVARISNSRYTKKDELLEDLKRLDLSDLSFKERHKLIAQIKESYVIFK